MVPVILRQPITILPLSVHRSRYTILDSNDHFDLKTNFRYRQLLKMGYWGQYLFQSDPDLDIVDSLGERAGLELYMFESEEDLTKARNAFNEGKFNELFDVIRAEKKKKSLILLTALAMQMGATVKKNQRNLIEQIYKKAHLMEGAEKQVEKALKEYENGKPWEFKESKGLIETMQNGPEEGFTSPFLMMGGGESQKPEESAKGAEKEGPPKTFEERAKENMEKIFRDPNYQKYFASALEK